MEVPAKEMEKVVKRAAIRGPRGRPRVVPGGPPREKKISLVIENTQANIKAPAGKEDPYRSLRDPKTGKIPMAIKYGNPEMMKADREPGEYDPFDSDSDDE